MTTAGTNTVTVFMNPGEIDLRVVSTMGVNVKESKNPIGYFGTGLKYAIATILRNGGTVDIWKGTQRFPVRVEHENIRGQRFGVVYLGTTPCGFTTELGKNWKLWQAFRELYSNMLDEQGELTSALAPAAGRTSIVVNSAAFAAEARAKDQYFLHGRVPLWSNSELELYEGENTHLYYRGVRVNKLEHRSRFTLNVLSPHELTEDRILESMYMVTHEISHVVQTELDNPALLLELLTRDENEQRPTFEGQVRYDTFGKSSEQFLSAVNTLGRRNAMPSAWKCWLMNKPLDERHEAYEPTQLELKTLERAQAFLTRLGFDTSGHKVAFVRDLDRSVLAAADRANNTVVLSARVLAMGTKQLASTLLEEHLHITRGWADCTREMQNGLFDLMMSLGEQVTGEPI